MGGQFADYPCFHPLPGIVTFAVLADEAEWCRRRGVELRLVSRQPIVARIAKACGLTELLPIYPNVALALAEPAA